MATDQKLSTLVESQLPSFLLEEGPKFVSFIKAYYEWLETTNQATDALKNLIVNQDLDTTNLNQFYDYFRREVLSEFPENVLADKRLLAKQIKDLYRAKGTQQAHRLLFRLLYNEEIEFYDPSRNILKTSDGRWVKQNSIRLGFPLTGQAENLVNEIVVGQESGASAKVESVVTTRESGVEVKELFLSEISGTFFDLETVSNQANTFSGVIVNSVGPLKSITIPDFRFSRGGSGHVRGDRVSFTSASGSGATGFVTSTSDSVTTFVIQNGGSGYRIGNNTVVTLFGGQGFDGEVTVTSISNPEIVFRYSDTIQGLSDTPIGFGPTYSSNSGIVSANLASANAFTALSAALGTLSTTVGTINSISVIAGNYFTLPGVSAVDLEIALLELPDGSGGIKGKNAVIVPLSIPGAIQTASVLVPGARYNAADPVTIANLSRTGTIAGLGNPVISGVVENAGKYIDTKGFLSWDQFLQDGNYYQIFSYVIKSDQAIKTYRNLVNKLVHPAGTKFFGQVDIEDTIDLSGDIDTEAFILTNLIGGANGISSILSTITFGLPVFSRTLPVESITTTVIFGPTVVLRAISPASILSTAAISGNTELIFNIDPEPVLSTLTFGDLNWNFAFTLNSIDPTVTFGTSLLIKSISPVSIEPTAILSPNNVLVMFVDPVSLTSTISFNGNQLNFEYDVPSLDITTVFSPNTLLLVLGTGTVSVSNNNTVTTYLDEPISNYLNNEIVIFGTPFTVIGNNTIFTVELSSGAVIEIQDLDPGVTGNTTYIVNTVFSNTSLSITTPFVGGALANGIFRYTQS